MNQYAPVHRPRRFQLIVVHHAEIIRRRSAPPNQLSVSGSQAIDPSISSPEQYQFSVHRGRCIDSSSRRVAPKRRAIVGAESPDRVRIGRSQKDAPAGNHRTGESAAQFDIPGGFQLAGYDRTGTTAASCVVTISRPIFGRVQRRVSRILGQTISGTSF